MEACHVDFVGSPEMPLFADPCPSSPDSPASSPRIGCKAFGAAQLFNFEVRELISAAQSSLSLKWLNHPTFFFFFNLSASGAPFGRFNRQLVAPIASSRSLLAPKRCTAKLSTKIEGSGPAGVNMKEENGDARSGGLRCWPASVSS